MTLPVIALIASMAIIAAGFAVSYVLLLSKFKAMLIERQLKIADQFAALDDAIRALETRVGERQLQETNTQSKKPVENAEQPDPRLADAGVDEESGEIAPEIQAAIAAATVAALGPDAIVQSVKPVPSPWSQQGRVMVQGGHNLRVHR